MNDTNIFDKPFPLSDEEVIRKALSTVTAHIKSHSHESVNVNDCVEVALQQIKHIWREVRGHRRWSYTLKEADILELAEITSRIREELTERAIKKAASLLKRQKIRKISTSAAEVKLNDALGGMGLKYHIIRQVYRIKVRILLPNNNILQFVILYSELAAGKTEEILNGIQTILGNLVNSGRDIQIMCGRGKVQWQ